MMENYKLQKMIEHGDLPQLKKLLSEGLSINYKLYFGETLLIYAMKYAQSEMARFLIKEGADINIRSDDGSTALTKCSCFAPDMSRYLIEKGAKFDLKDTPQTAIGKAAFDGDLELLKFYLQQGVDIDCRNQYLSTPLIEAANCNRLQCVEYLIEKGANVNAQDHSKQSALLKACLGNHLGILEILLDFNADPYIKNQDGMNALHLAICKGMKDVLNRLLKLNWNWNDKVKYGFTPLILAVSTNFYWKNSSKSAEITKILLETPVDLDAKDELGNTAVHHAAISGFNDSLLMLISSGADFRVKNNKGERPLDVAIARGVFGYGMQERQTVRPSRKEVDPIYSCVKTLLEYEPKPIHHRRLNKLKKIAKSVRCPETMSLF